jgi:hypothetical protein
MNVIPAVTSSSVVHGVLIKMTVNTSTYTIANTYSPVVYNGTTYLGLGHYLGMNEIQDDLRATNNVLQLSLSGIPKDPGEAGLGDYSSFVSLILGSKIKGSRVQIYRAFFDTITGALLPDSVSLRFSGYVSNYTISDSTDVNSRSDSYTCVIQMSSIHAILEKNIVGRRTNSIDQKLLYPTDICMDRVVAISKTSFDFGKPYTGGGTGSPGGGGGGSPNNPDYSNYNF